MSALRYLASALRVFVLASLLLGSLAQAQNTLFVNDEVFIVLHAGPGTNFRWIAKLNPGLITALGQVRRLIDRVTFDRRRGVLLDHHGVDIPLSLRSVETVEHLLERKAHRCLFEGTGQRLQSVSAVASHLTFP